MSIALDKALAKAQRLIDTGAVTIHGEAIVATVDGDHGHYLVTAAPVGNSYATSCTCPSTSPDCSHSLAVRKLITERRPEPVDPFEGLI